MYKYNGNTYSLEDLKIVLGVEEITQDILTQYGITEAEEEVKIDPPTTTVDEVGKSNDVVEDAIATSDEERASMLELELERISSELEKIDPYKDAETVTYKSFGGYEQKQIGVDNAALKKEEELKEISKPKGFPGKAPDMPKSEGTKIPEPKKQDIPVNIPPKVEPLPGLTVDEEAKSPQIFPIKVKGGEKKLYGKTVEEYNARAREYAKKKRERDKAGESEKFRPEAEKKAMEYIANDVDEWITNAAQNRARIAKEEIIALLVAHCNENDVQLAVGQDAQIDQAYDLGVVQKLSEIVEEESEV